MRRAAAIVTALAVALPAAATATDAQGAAAAPARMLVTADEWMLLTSRQSIRAGRLDIQLYNRGEDAHDLAARRVARDGSGVGRTFRLRETRPGELEEGSWRLSAGKYRLWCSLPRHEDAGMRARLRVRTRIS